MARRDFLLGYMHAMRKVAESEAEAIARIAEKHEKALAEEKAKHNAIRREYNEHMTAFKNRVREAFDRQILDPNSSIENPEKMVRDSMDAVSRDARNQAAMNRSIGGVRAPVLEGAGRGGLGTAALIGAGVAIPVGTGLGLYLLHRSRNK